MNNEQKRQILINEIRHITALTTPNVSECVDSILKQFAELRQPIEDLVQRIESIIETSIDGEGRSFESQVTTAATEIAQLLSTNEGNADELYEALKRAKSLIGIFRLKENCSTQETWDIINKAIENYEKSKQ